MDWRTRTFFLLEVLLALRYHKNAARLQAQTVALLQQRVVGPLFFLAFEHRDHCAGTGGHGRPVQASGANDLQASISNPRSNPNSPWN